jgi:arabinosyltransferase C
MQQAADGNILFENRFTGDKQPGLTLHLYFLALGWVAKVFGIPLTLTAARVGFSYLCVVLLGRFIALLKIDLFTKKLATVLAVFGMGIGPLVWEDFGRVITGTSPLSGALLGRLPVDVWQPEGFFFSSALTNSLFMVSGCLILGCLICITKAETKQSLANTLTGAGCFGLLMNIHSYDVLLVGLILVGVLLSRLASHRATVAWIGHSSAMVLGSLPFALWFVYVLKTDPVFASRAATPTYTGNFRTILGGYALFMLATLPLITRVRGVYQRIGIAMFCAFVVTLYVIAHTHLGFEYFVSSAGWICMLIAAYAIICLLAPNGLVKSVVVSWAIVGLVAPYFPALFQRKLMMLLSIPWGILAATGLAALFKNCERSQRNLLATLAVVVFSGGCLRWVSREMMQIRKDVSLTTTHPVYIPNQVFEIIQYFRQSPTPVVAQAPMGIAAKETDAMGAVQEGKFGTPILPDLNSFLTGLGGIKTYAGHWSETPQYLSRIGKVSSAISASQTYPTETRQNLRMLGITHLVMPLEWFENGIPTDLGEIVLKTKDWSVIKL